MMSRNPFRQHRLALGLSQAGLSRLAGVSRFKLNTYEAGGADLTAEELTRVLHALKAQAQVVRKRLDQLQDSPVWQETIS